MTGAWGPRGEKRWILTPRGEEFNDASEGFRRLELPCLRDPCLAKARPSRGGQGSDDSWVHTTRAVLLSHGGKGGSASKLRPGGRGLCERKGREIIPALHLQILKMMERPEGTFLRGPPGIRTSARSSMR